MKIGPISLENPTVLAPLAGITNLPFRLMAKEAGCGLVCSEMISANGVVHGTEKTLRMLDSRPEEKPLSIQIFGTDPDIMAEAACRVEAAGADLIDINFGCSVRKVVKTGAGAALMRTPERAEAVLTAVRRSVSMPVTIKIRSGWDPSGDQAVHTAKMAQDCGVDAIAVHPRTATQGFRGWSDWSLIGRVRRELKIPVMGNGDILCAGDALRMMSETGCDAVMIGRAAIGYPWIFSETIALLNGQVAVPATFRQRAELMVRYLEASVAHMGEIHACRVMRSRLGWFTKGMPHSARFRESIKRVATEAECRILIAAYLASLN